MHPFDSSNPDPHNLLIVTPLFFAYLLGSVTGLRVSCESRNAASGVSSWCLKIQTWLAVQNLPAATNDIAPPAGAEAQLDAPTKSVNKKARPSCAVVLGLVIGAVSGYCLALGATMWYFGVENMSAAFWIALTYLMFPVMLKSVS